jgi:predicted amidohydrolase YtcJ
MPPGDLVITNANIITLNDNAPRASAMTMWKAAIVYVGDDSGAIRAAAPEARHIDLAGQTIVPGFCDSHIHLLWYGQQLLTQADLVGSSTIDDLLARLTDLAQRSEGWIQGHGFDQDKLADRRFPTREDLDRVSRTRPIIISRICGHAVVVNSAALALLDPAERAAGDAETGLYTEDTASYFYRRIPPLDLSQMEQAALLACNVALRTGITSVHTLLDTPEQMIAWSRLHARKKLPIRIMAIPHYTSIETLAAHGVRTGTGDRFLRFGGAKLFSDGSLGAHTALLSSPYTDDPTQSGIRMYPPQTLKEHARDAQDKGFQAAIHAIGDQALRETIDVIEHALAGDSNTHHRHRIEHASLCPPDCLERLAKHKIVCTLQPQFVRSDSWTPQRIGPARVPWAYPFRSLLRAGVPITLSSDCPVEKLDAFACLAAAVGGDEWRPDQTLSVEESLRAYCLGSAYAGHAESWSGSLEPGKVADFVVLSTNPLDLHADQIANVRAERVFINGREVERSERDAEDAADVGDVGEN